MSLDVWFRSDVQRILAAVSAAGDLHGPDYRRAVEDVGIAFGVTVDHLRPPCQVVDAPPRLPARSSPFRS